MMVPPDESNQQFVEDALPEETDETAVPVKLDTLQPWHKPRKQFIRERQWIYFSRRLIDRELNSPGLQVPAGGVPEVRYLTLPGIDYLDVRLLADLCDEFGCLLTNTGFLAGGEGNSYIARAKVREDSLIKAGYITNESYTFERRFEDITSAQGQAYRELQRKGPFHIINVDACGSIAAPTAQHANRLIDAIYRLVEYQFANKSGRWLLFLTADVRQDSLEPETLDRLCDAVLKNAEESAEFHEEVLSLFDQNEADIGTVVEEASGSHGEKFLKLFSLSFAKWLLHLSISKNWDMKTHSSYCYSTGTQGNDVPTMVCLAFEFLPPPAGLEDQFQVVNAAPVIGGQADDTSIRAVNKIAGMENLDCRMGLCNLLRASMVERTKELLQEAGYIASALAELEA